MEKDGSLLEVGFDANCMEWIEGAIELSKADDPRKEYIVCTICLKKTNEIIGAVGCPYYNDIDEVGITSFIGEQYRGNGFAAESVLAYKEYFFSHYPIEKLIATIREANVASWKTIEVCSFVLVETKMYQDINDEEAKLYRFYEIHH